MFGNSDTDTCKRLIYGTLVDGSCRDIKIRGDFKPVLEPYACKQYPLSRAGMLPRITRRYLENWVNIPRLTRWLRQDPRIDGLFRRARPTKKGTYGLMKDVLSRIGTLSYTQEWSTVAAGAQLEEIIEKSTAITVDANKILAHTLRDKIVDHFRSGPRRRLKVMDVGVGWGNTIVPLLDYIHHLEFKEQVIPPGSHKNVQVFLVDVSQHAIDFTYKRLTSRVPGMKSLEGMTPVGNIVSVPVNFADIEYSPILKDHENQIDIIVSGAAICHQTDLLPFFRQMNALLRPATWRDGRDCGVLHAWDWYNGPSWAAPRLRLSEDDGRRSVYYITDLDGRVSVKTVEDGKGLEGIEKGDLYSRLENAKHVGVVYEIAPEDVGPVVANFETLLGVLGFVEGSGYMRDSRKFNGIEIGELLKSMFFEYIDTPRSYDPLDYHNQGFSYFEDFLGKVVPALDDPRPFIEESAYYLIEGYGDDYSRAMLKGGFRWAMDEYFIDVYHRFKEVANRELTDTTPVCQIRYTFGWKGDERRG